MSENTTPGASGQDTDPTTDNTDPEVLHNELLAALEQVKALAGRLIELREAEEPESGEEEEPAPGSDDEPTIPPLRPPFALRSDGRLLLCIDDLDAYDLGPRTVFRFVVCNSNEKAFILENLDAAAHDTMGRFPSIFARRKDEPEGSGGDGEG